MPASGVRLTACCLQAYVHRREGTSLGSLLSMKRRENKRTQISFSWGLLGKKVVEVGKSESRKVHLKFETVNGGRQPRKRTPPRPRRQWNTCPLPAWTIPPTLSLDSRCALLYRYSPCSSDRLCLLLCWWDQAGLSDPESPGCQLHR